jgi:peptidoglycan hydrolase CwlO-like protein
LVQVVHRLEREIAENRQEIVDLRAELNAQSSTLKKRMR